MIFGPAVLNSNVLALNTAGFPQAKTECRDEVIGQFRSSAAEEPNHGHLRLLRTRSLRHENRRCSRTTNQRDELPPSHSIISSARASNVGGTVRPSALAVLRLTTSSYLVAAWTGSSPGFSALDLGRVAHIDRGDLHPDRRRRGLDDAELGGAGGRGGISKDCHSRHAWGDLLEQLQPFPGQAVFENHEPGGVATRPRQAVDEAGTDRVGNDRKHNRHGARHLQQRPNGRGPMGQDDVGRERGQFRRVPANFGEIA